MKKRLPTIIMSLVFLAGLSILLYPTVSDWWNTLHQSRAVSEYAETVENADHQEYEKLLNDAKIYNETLAKKNIVRFMLSDEEAEAYNALLNISGTGMMGYIEIPVIKVMLPVYHGTSDAVLTNNVGHLEGTSLPVGGENTHCVISGHRGLPSAKLFTNLDQMEEGDVFYLHVLNETLAYEVDQIVTVNPDEIEELYIRKGQDLCTLVTCTPYGINSHRLLVRGHRVETPENAANHLLQEMNEPVKWNQVCLGAVCVGGLLAIALMIWRWRRRPGKRRRRRRRKRRKKK